jgi:hypothetical protein
VTCAGAKRAGMNGGQPLGPYGSLVPTVQPWGPRGRLPPIMAGMRTPELLQVPPQARVLCRFPTGTRRLHCPTDLVGDSHRPRNEPPGRRGGPRGRGRGRPSTKPPDLRGGGRLSLLRPESCAYVACRPSDTELIPRSSGPGVLLLLTSVRPLAAWVVVRWTVAAGMGPLRSVRVPSRAHVLGDSPSSGEAGPPARPAAGGIALAAHSGPPKSSRSPTARGNAW